MGWQGGLLLLLGVAQLCMVLLFVHACWKLLPVAHRKTTPLRAALFLLIPFFNCFWVHVAFYEFLAAANRVLRLRGQTARVQLTIARWMAPCAFLTLLPRVGNGFFLIFALLLCGFGVQAYKVGLALADPPPAGKLENEP